MKSIFSVFFSCFTYVALAQSADSTRYESALIQSGKEKKSLHTPHPLMLQIPKIVTPQGAVFCRMEDFITQKTKVWVKIGVK